jgi:alkylation response protein AidB-like acyl-CoA dehydrogenase
MMKAVGYLVGEEHKGMRAMFTMMNEARLGVGLQGLSQAELAYQNALSYAKDRLQGRDITGYQKILMIWPTQSLFIQMSVGT